MDQSKENLKKERDEYLCKAKEIEYQIREKENSGDNSKMSRITSEIISILSGIEPHERKEFVDTLRSAVKESIASRMDEIEKELCYLKDVGQSL